MLHTLIVMAFGFLAASANAAAIQANPAEGPKEFAARYAPNDASEVVHVAPVSAWNLNKPLIVAFYQYPVSYADKSKNYGDSPNESEVLGVVFVPISPTEYRHFEIDGYGPEGANAEINSFFFARTDKTSDEKLFVMVSWHNNNGVLYSTYVYDKPQLTSATTKLTYLKELSQRFGLECDYCSDGDKPGKPAKFKKAADVKAELKKLIK